MLASVMAAMATAAVAQTTGYWVSSVSGELWTNPDNWTNCPGLFPNGVRDVAYLTAPQAADVTVYLTTNITVGQLVMENDGYILDNSNGLHTLTFDNGGAGAYFAWLDVANPARDRNWTVKNRILVADDLRIYHYGRDGYSMTFSGDVVGNSNRTVELSYQLGSTTALNLDGNNTGFLGTLVLRNAYQQSYLNGWVVSSPAEMIGGGPGCVRLASLATVRFTYAVSQSDARRLWFSEDQNVLSLTGGGTFTNVPNSASFIPPGGAVSLGDNTSTVHTNRWPDTDPVPLSGAKFRLSGRANYVVHETVGAVSFDDGSKILMVHNGGTSATTRLYVESIARTNRGTLVFLPSGGRLGSPSNQVYVTGGSPPAVVNGMTGPWYVIVSNELGTGGAVADFSTYGPAGFEQATYDCYDTFAGAGATGKVSIGGTSFNLAGQAVEAWALKTSAALTNGSVRLHSGGLILGGGSRNHRADFAFGTESNAEALIYFGGHDDMTVIAYLSGSLACSNLTKFGRLPIQLAGTNTHLKGSVHVNEDGIIIAHPEAIHTYNDVRLGYAAYLGLRTDAQIGGLTGKTTSLVTTNGAGPRLLSLTPAAGSTHTFSGTIRGGMLSLNVAGNGTQVLSGSNTYAGATTVSSGRLTVNGYLASTGVVAKSGAFLGGTGQMDGEVRIEGGGRLEPGGTGTIGGLTLGALSLESGAQLEWEYGGGTADLVRVTGVTRLPEVAEVLVTSLGGNPPTPAILVSSGSLTGVMSLARWNITGLPGYSAIVSGNSVVLRRSVGTLLVVR